MLIKETKEMSEAEARACRNTNAAYLRSIALPVGAILDFAGDTVPNGALLCDGSAVSRTVYSELFAVIGTTFGEGDGESTFNLPDMRGKMSVGTKAGDSDLSEVGKTGGEKAHTLTADEMPAHSHSFTGVNESSTMTDSAGNYPIRMYPDKAANWNNGSGIAETGGGQAHNNMPPFLVINKIIVAFGGTLMDENGVLKPIWEPDDTYNPESVNPQSGKAVAEALKAERTYVNNNFANALKGSASGKVVRLTDVSPIEHTLGAKVSSKNLIPFYNRHGTATESGITYTIDDLIITANGTVTGNQSQYFLFNGRNVTQGVLNVDPTETFYISGCPEGGSASTYYLGVLLYKDTTNVAMFKETGNGFLLYQPDVDYNRVLFKIYIAKGTTVNNLVFKPQMERGSAATPFAPYLLDVTTVTVTRYGAVETDSPQTYTPAVDGTVSGVKSLYPTTTLTTNNSGAIINAEYNRDINKAFAELQQAIISLGGGERNGLE